VSVELPRELAEGVARLLHDVGPRDLARTSAALSAKYRQHQERTAPVARSEAEIVAYVATRLPATYAAITSALTAVRDLRPDWQPRTLLDLGAGPGTAAWSATAVWPSLERVTAVEVEPRMVAIGRELGRAAGHPAARQAAWVRASASDPLPPGTYDLVVLAYLLGELGASDRDRLIERAANATLAPTGLTVVVEPGTPVGHTRVLAARDRLLAAGGHVTAPCPHDAPCPKAGADWCHFAVRLPRTAIHRAAKQADLGYEDEKFSYVAVSRQPTARVSARVVRHPRLRPRLVQLELCTPGGLRSTIVTKRQGKQFRLARKTAWGEGFEYTDGDANDRRHSANA
jgi:ribosomal protein RSM22 (predicted rRNA methylase)